MSTIGHRRSITPPFLAPPGRPAGLDRSPPVVSRRRALLTMGGLALTPLALGACSGDGALGRLDLGRDDLERSADAGVEAALSTIILQVTRHLRPVPAAAAAFLIASGATVAWEAAKDFFADGDPEPELRAVARDMAVNGNFVLPEGSLYARGDRACWTATNDNPTGPGVVRDGCLAAVSVQGGTVYLFEGRTIIALGALAYTYAVEHRLGPDDVAFVADRLFPVDDNPSFNAVLDRPGSTASYRAAAGPVTCHLQAAGALDRDSVVRVSVDGEQDRTVEIPFLNT